MDHLPLEVHVKIFSFLSLNDRVKCRLVSTAFKQAAETSLNSITHLEGQNDGRIRWPVRVEDGVATSLTEEKFFSRPFVDARVKCGRVGESTFFTFLATYCPNLRVFAVDYPCAYEQLIQIAPSIQFFSCEGPLVQNDLLRQPESLFGPFKMLQGFKCSSSEFSVAFAKYLHMHNRPIFKLYIRSAGQEDIDHETLQSMAQTGISCLNISMSDTSIIQHISESLANCLVDLTIYFNPSDNFCKFTLANLRYLKMKSQYLTAECNPFLCQNLTPNLMSFEYSGSAKMALVHQLLQFIYSLEKLKSATLGLKVEDTSQSEDEDEPVKVVTFALPPNLRELTVDANLPLQVTNNSSRSLRCLRVAKKANTYVSFPSHPLVKRRMHSFDFHFPNLKLFDCDSERLNSLPLELFQSLSRCSKLVTFHLKLTVVHLPTADEVQSLMDILARNTRLHHLQFILYSTGKCSDELVGPFSAGTVHFRQKDFPSLKKVKLTLSHKLIYYPTDSFDRLSIVCYDFNKYGCYFQELKFASHCRDMDYRVEGTSVIVIPTEQMNRLVSLDVRLPCREEHSQAIESFISRCEISNLQSLSFSYRPVYNSKSTEEREMHVLELAKFEKIFFCSKNFKNLEIEMPCDGQLFDKLLDHFNSLNSSAKIVLKLDFGHENRKSDLRVHLPGPVDDLGLITKSSLDLSAATSHTLASLEIVGDVNVPFDLPNLRKFVLKQSVRPPGPGLLHSLEKSPQLRSFELSFAYDAEYQLIPDASLVSRLFQVLSQLKLLEKLTLKAEEINLRTRKGRVLMHQKDFPSLVEFSWRFPFNLTFHPIEVFDCINICSKKYLFLDGTANRMRYELERKPGSVKLQFEPNMSKSVRLHINSLLPLKEFEPLEKIIEVQFNFRFDQKSQEQLVDWAASLASLESFSSDNLSQAGVESFLTKLKSTGPLTINIGRGLTKVSRMEDQLHRLVSSLMASKVISSFNSSWTCREEKFDSRLEFNKFLPFCCPPS